MTAVETNDGFQFYLRFAKPLVLNLSSPRDRILAAAWVQKLKDEKSGEEKLRTNYLKLLLFVLQKGRLFGPFVNNPAQHETLEEFPMSVKLRDIAKSWIEAEESQKRARLMEGLGAGDFPPLTTECSADLLEYVAAQDIPNFGVHAYYAISNEPLNTWENLEKGIFPKGALSAVKKSGSADVSLEATAKRTRSRSRSRSRSRTVDDTDITGRERSSVAAVSFIDDFGHFPGKATPDKISSPLGSPPPPDRTGPTWGSNLIGVGDPPTPEGMAFAPDKDAEKKAKETPSSKSVSLKDTSAFSLPYKTPPWDMSAPSISYQTPPVRRQLDFEDTDRKTSTPKMSTCFTSFPEEEASDLFQEEAPDLFQEETPDFLADEDVSAPSVPYRTPPWDMSAPSLPYQTPPGGQVFDFPDLDVTPIVIPPKLQFETPSPRAPMPRIGTYLPPLPGGEASDIFMEETPSFFMDEDIMTTPPKPTRAFFEEAPSLPYQTPPWDMSAPSIPYRSPEWDMSAASLPYRTPPYDPYKTAETQYASLLFDSPRVTTSSPRRSPKRAPPPPAGKLREDIEMEDFLLMEKMFEGEDTTGSTTDFSALESWAEGPDDTPPSVIPKKDRAPAKEVQEVLAKGISVSPEAEDIVSDAMREMSIIAEQEKEADLEELYAEQEAAHPHRIRGMRTPPVFSKHERIREAGKDIRYREEQFGIKEPIDWRPAEKAIPSESVPTSPPEDLRRKFRKRPFEELFPGVQVPIDYYPFEEEDEIELIDDELLKSPAKKDIQKRLHEVIHEIDRIGDEVPAMGGVAITTPRRPSTPVRSPERDDDDELFFFTEKPPEDFGMSPEDYLSPLSKAEAQWEALQRETTITPRPRTPTPPPRMDTPEFLREQRRLEQMPREVLFAPEPEAEQPESAETRRKGITIAEEEETEEEEVEVDKEVQELYKSLVQDEEEYPEITPPSPVSPPSPWSPGIHIERPNIVIPPKLDPMKFICRTPSQHRRMLREEFPEALEFEEEPEFYEPEFDSPPSPPSPFEYESPYMSPLDDSPPLREMLEAHEFTEDFFDPRRPHMRTSVMVRGRRVPVSRHSRAPPLSPIQGYVEDFDLPSPPPGDAFERALAKARAIPPPTPPTPVAPSPARARSRAPPAEEETKKPVCKKLSKGKGPKIKGPKPTTSKTKLKRPSKTKIKKTEEGRPPSPARERTPPRETPPKRPEIIRPAYRPLTRKEHYFAQSFTDPKHQELVARVARLIADVGSPLLQSPPPERDEFEHIEGGEELDISPPGGMPPLEEDLPELSPTRPPSPLSPLPEFDFQSDVQDFMTPPRQFKLPAVPPITPRSPPIPAFIPPPYVSPISPFSSDMLMDTSPELATTPIASPESPDIDPLIFTAEVLEAKSPTYYDAMMVRQGRSRFRMVRRKSPKPRHGKIYEAPETAEFEEHMPFHERIASIPGPNLRRRSVRAGVRKVPRHSAAPGLLTVPEHVEYPDSPITSRSPRPLPRRPPSPQRPPVVEEEGEKLIDIPCEPCGTPAARAPVRQRPSRISGRTVRRRIDFDAEASSPQTPRRPPVPTAAHPLDDLYDEAMAGPPPEDLMGVDYPVQYEKEEMTIMDYSPPGHLPSPIRPKFKLDWWETPPHLKPPVPPKKEFEFKLMPRLKNVLDYQSPIEFPESPEPLPEEIEDDFPLATGMPGFPPVSPFELPPSPVKTFGRQITPEARRRGPTAARVVTPPRVVRPPAPGLLEAHRQYQMLLMDTPPETAAPAVCPAAAAAAGRTTQAPARVSPPRRAPAPPRIPSPPKRPSSTVIRKTSKTIISPERQKTVTTEERSMVTPPMMIPPPRDDPFLRGADIDLFSEEMPEIMEGSPMEEMRRGARRAPARTTRRPVQLYGYGEKKPLKLERKPRAPDLETVVEAGDEPTDEYEYWPGPFKAQVTRPPPIYSGGRLAPAIYRNVPPVSAKGRGSPSYFGGGIPIRPRRIRPPPPSLSPPQDRPRRHRIPREAMTARRKLEFEDSPKTYVEHIERLVADIPEPEGIEAPQLPPAAHIDFVPPEWSPVPIRALDRPGAIGLEDVEPPIEFTEYESPRTPKKSPELPVVQIEQTIEEYSPPPDMSNISPTFSPVMDISPPPGMEELDEFESISPPQGYYSPPGGSPEELVRRVREHEYTIHMGDKRKQHLSKYVHVKGRPYKVRRSQAPSLRPLEEREETEEAPKAPYVRHVREEKIIETTPPRRDPMQEVLAMAEQQYAMLLDSPEREEHLNVMDQPIGLETKLRLPPPITEPQFEINLPKISIPKVPPRFVPPRPQPRPQPRPPPMSSPERFAAIAPPGQDYMLDLDESPPLFSTPPRDIFAEAMEMEEEEEEDIEALLTGSPVRRSPPGGGPPCGPCGSPVSPDFMQRVREHQIPSGFMDPRRPMARKHVRSRERVVSLPRRAPSPPLERLEEKPEQPIAGVGARGLMPPIYPSDTPPSAERHYEPPIVSDIKRSFPRRFVRPSMMIQQPQESPVKSVQRAPPRRRLAFDDLPPSPERTPDKVTTTETVTYEDPQTGAPVTETTVEETVYARTPQRPTTPKKKSPCSEGPCSPPPLSPREYDISTAFGGQLASEILDTSDIPEDVDMEPFAWLNRR